MVPNHYSKSSVAIKLHECFGFPINPDQCDFSLRAVSAVKMVAGTEKAKERPPPGPGASRPVLLFILVLFPREEKTGSLHFAT